jgi:hypothetical protein
LLNGYHQLDATDEFIGTEDSYDTDRPRSEPIMKSTITNKAACRNSAASICRVNHYQQATATACLASRRWITLLARKESKTNMDLSTSSDCHHLCSIATLQVFTYQIKGNICSKEDSHNNSGIHPLVDESF